MSESNWSATLPAAPGRYPVRIAADPTKTDEFDWSQGLQFIHVGKEIVRVEKLEFGPAITTKAPEAKA